jgi:hypothetical protein
MKNKVNKIIQTNEYKFKFSYYDFSLKSLFLYKEFLRMKLIQELENDIKIIFKLKNFSLYSLLLKIKDKKKDPLLGIIKEDELFDKKIRDYINKKINKIMNILQKLKNKKEVVKKYKEGKNIILEYKTYKISIKLSSYYRIKNQIVDYSFKEHIDFHSLLWILYFRYKSFYLYNNSQISVHNDFYKKISDKFFVDMECFGSFFNHTLKYYYGLFPDIEKYFGCLGNFYNSEFIKGFYVVNPPFTIDHITDSILHILKQLNKSKEELVFLIVIPVWVNDDREKLNKLCDHKLKLENYDSSYYYKKIITKAKKSDYINKYLLYCKNNFKYYSYLTENSVYVSATNLILLSNRKKKYNIEKIFGDPNIKVI